MELVAQNCAVTKKIVIGNDNNYDAGVHPEVAEIEFHRDTVGNFFRGDRFPGLVKLDCTSCALKKLELNCPSLVHQQSTDRIGTGLLPLSLGTVVQFETAVWTETEL